MEIKITTTATELPCSLVQEILSLLQLATQEVAPNPEYSSLKDGYTTVEDNHEFQVYTPEEAAATYQDMEGFQGWDIPLGAKLIGAWSSHGTKDAALASSFTSWYFRCVDGSLYGTN